MSGRSMFCVSGFLSLCLSPLNAWAAMVGGFDVIDSFHFLDARQGNPNEVRQGVFESFGIDLTPVPGTTVTASRGTFSGNVPYLNSPALPNQFFVAVPFDPAQTGALDLALTNPVINSGLTAHVLTRTLDGVAPPPFVTDVTLTGGGLAPTISWARPSGYIPSSQSISIFDGTHLTPTGASTLIFNTNISATQNTFAIPNGVLSAGTRYGFGVQLDEHQATNVALSGTLVARSRSFVEFTALAPSFQGTVALPTRGIDTNLNDNRGAPFRFNIAVSAGVPLLIDPVVASGYVYRVGAGDPLISSVALPDIGDPSFDLYLWNGSQFVFESVLAPSVRHTFVTPVDRFQIRGIDTALGVDPTNPLGFVTELVFAGDGRFTGTQTPITMAVPEPGMYAMLLAGLGMLGWMRRRSKSTAGLSFLVSGS